MKKYFDEIQRGKSSKETNRNHFDTNKFKEITNFYSQLKSIKNILTQSNEFINSENKNEITKLFNTILPNGKMFLSELNNLQKSLLKQINSYEKTEKELNHKEKSVMNKLNSQNNFYKKPYEELQKNLMN